MSNEICIKPLSIEKINIDIDIEESSQEYDYSSYNYANEFCKMINKDTYFIINAENELELHQKEKTLKIESNIKSLLKIIPEKKILFFKQKNNRLCKLDYEKKSIEIFNLDTQFSDIILFDDGKIFILGDYKLCIYHYDNFSHSIIFDSKKKFAAAQIIPLKKSYIIIAIENKLYLSKKEEIEKLEEKDCYAEIFYGIYDENGPYISFVNLQNKLGNYFMNFNSENYIIKFNLLLNDKFCISYGDNIYIYSLPNANLVTKLNYHVFSQMYQVSNQVYILYNKNEIQILGKAFQTVKNFKLKEKIDLDSISLSNNTINKIFCLKSDVCPICKYNKLYRIGIFFDNSYASGDMENDNLDSICGQTQGFIISLNKRDIDENFVLYEFDDKCGFCKYNI